MSSLTLGAPLPTLLVEVPRAAATTLGLKVTLPDDQDFVDLEAVLVLTSYTGDIEWLAVGPTDEGDTGNTQRFYWNLEVVDTDLTFNTCEARLELRRAGKPAVMAAGKAKFLA